MPPKRSKRVSIRKQASDIPEDSSSSKKRKTSTQHANNRSSSPSSRHDLNTIVTEVTKRVLESLRSEHAITPSNTLHADNALTAGRIDDAVANLTNELTGGTSTLGNAVMSDFTFNAPRAQQDSGPSVCHATCLDGALHQNVNTNCFPLGASVSPAVRGKILADEYINLGLLITPNQTEEFTLSVAQNTLQVRQLQRNRGIFNIDQWSQAFTIFTSVYIEKFNDHVHQLLKYSYLIREMAKTFPGYAWRSYDEQFRQSRAITKWPWDRVNQELYMRTVSVAFSATHPVTSNWHYRRATPRANIQHSRFDSRAPYRQPSRFYVNSQQRNSFGSKVEESSRYYRANREGQLDRGDNAGQRAQATGNADRLQ